MSTRATELAAQLIRNFSDVPLERFTREPHYDVLDPGKRGCPYHFHHAQEELFVVLEGAGTVRVAGEAIPIKAGDVVFIPPGPEYPHQIINTSASLLRYLSVSTMETPEICEYPDSDKYLARRGEGLEYWDGEP